MNQQISDYIAQGRAQGLSNEEIKRNLLAAGWVEAQINEALGITSGPSSPPPPPASSGPSSEIPKPPTSQSHSSNTMMAVLAYLGILVIVPLVSDAKNDPFVKFHAKQGLVLLIVWIVASVFSVVPFIGLISFFVYFIAFVLMIIGIMNASKGEMKELPVIGSWGNKFNF